MSQNFYPDRRKLKERYSLQLPSYMAALEKFQARLRVELSKSGGVHFTIKYRVKSFDSYYGKLLKRKRDEKLSGEAIPIHDIMGTRVVCPFLEDVEAAERCLRAAFTIHEIERKGAERTFSEFGYSSTHILLEIPQDVRDQYPDLDLKIAEVQIRTFLQDAWAEVEHELIYKNSNRITPMDDPLRRKLAALNANLSLSDDIFQEIRDYQRRLHCELNKRRHSFSAYLDEVKPGLTATAVPAPDANAGEDAGENGNGINGWMNGNGMGGGIFIKKDTRSIKAVKPADGGGGVADGLEDNPEDDMPELDSSNKDQLLLFALSAHNEKNYPLAIRVYTRILEQDVPPYIRALVLIHRGKAYFSQSNYIEAKNDFRTATDCEPGNNRGFYHLGIANRVLGDNLSAMKALRSCIEINPFHVDALFALGGAYFDMGDYPGALEYCEKALLLEPESASVKEFRKLVISKMKL